MKLSLQWLKELLGENVSDTDILESLEELGYEIENVSKFDPGILSNVKVVKLVSVKKHPNADKLTVCRITDGENFTEVVCGAPNVYEGMYAVYVPAGSVIAGGVKVESRKIRGVVSNGMLCSAKELGLYDDHTGILELTADFQLGSTLDRYLCDTIVEISTPANRYDCLGHIGIAKELAIKLNVELKIKQTSLVELENKKLPFFDVKVLSKDLCKRYIAIQINNVNNKVQLPFYIRLRLNTLGLRSINPIVDISNYVMLETGHSVHVFDHDKIVNEKIIVRTATKTEQIHALDGKRYTLDEDITVISDDEKPIAIAGIIGGENSCVDDNTTNILIESAVFNRSRIRIARKRLGITTEAAYRFERGSGWTLCETAASKMYQMILKYCGGQVVKFSDIKDVQYYNVLTSFQHTGIKTDLNFISSLIGVDIDTKHFVDLMRRLGFEIRISSENTTLNRQMYLLPPVDRQDIRFQADIAEEYLRFTGYEKIPETLPSSVQKFVEEESLAGIEKQIIKCLTSFGCSQAINYSLCSAKENDVVVNANEKKILVVNPVSNEFSELRLSLFTGLLKNLITNYNNQVENIALFELGKVFYKNNKQNIEELQLGIIVYGEHQYLSWRQQSQYKYDLYFICGIVETLFDQLKIEYVKEDGSYLNSTWLNKEFFHPVVCYVEKNNNSILSFVGGIKKEKFGLKLPDQAYYAEVYIEKLLKLVNKNKVYQPLPKFPFILRDLSFVVPEGTNFWEIKEKIVSFINSKDLLCNITLKDFYKKEKTNYITITLKLQHKNKTLTDEETNEFVNKILDMLGKEGIQLRQK